MTAHTESRRSEPRMPSRSRRLAYVVGAIACGLLVPAGCVSALSGHPRLAIACSVSFVVIAWLTIPRKKDFGL